jgi:hypothetical protein
MRTKQCKECNQEFELKYTAQLYCKRACLRSATRKRVRGNVRRFRDQKAWTFLHQKNSESEGDRIKVTYLKSPGIFNLLSDIGKKHNIIGIQITEGFSDQIGIVVAEASLEEE